MHSTRLSALLAAATVVLFSSFSSSQHQEEDFPDGCQWTDGWWIKGDLDGNGCMPCARLEVDLSWDECKDFCYWESYAFVCATPFNSYPDRIVSMCFNGSCGNFYGNNSYEITGQGEGVCDEENIWELLSNCHGAPVVFSFAGKCSACDEGH